MTKRYRRVNANPGQLMIKYGRDDCGHVGLMYSNGAYGATKPDAFVLSDVFERLPAYNGKSLVDVLKERGYDITTLKFSIEQKKKEEDNG